MLEVRSVDPRDVSVEDKAPVYRVRFATNPAGERMSSTEDIEILGAQDVREVLQWAADSAGGRDFTVSVLSAADGVRSSIQLATSDSAARQRFARS